MALHIVALGDAGARMARSVLHAMMAGLTPKEPLTVTLMCAGEDAASGLQAAWQDYLAIGKRMGSCEDGCFSRQGTLRTWPEEQAAFSLNDQAKGRLDRLLSRALFTREQASLSPARAMDAGYDVAAMSWASMLSAEATGALLTLQQDLADDATRVVLLGSLCDTVCASGVQALCTWMGRTTSRKPSATLLLPVYAGESSDLCERILNTADLESRLSSLCLLGLPEDCRPKTHGDAQLCDWLAVYAACKQLNGMEGSRLWRIRIDSIHWDVFGDDAACWQQGYDALMQMAYLLAGVYGDQLTAAIGAHNRLRDRMTPWYNAHFSAVRKMSDSEREDLLADVEAFKRLLGGYCAWMRQMQQNLPPMMRWAEALRDARTEAEAHYQQVLDVVGQYTWLALEIQRSGMEDEHIIHRYDMRDTEAEAAIKKRDALLDQITGLSSAQDELNHKLGGRMTRSMLNTIAAQCAAQADEQRQIVEKAAEVIDHAADIAKQDELSKIATARMRLERKQRLVEMLDGRTNHAKRDAERWGGRALRKLPPVLPEDVAAMAAPALYADDWLCVVCAWFDGDDKAHKQLADLWPWHEKPMKPLCDRIARNEFPDAEADCLGGFLVCVVRCLMA